MSLGSTVPRYDQRVIDIAHKTGIPPQFVKGQIRQESGGNPRSYRYEPCGSDLAYISSNLEANARGPKIGLLPYSDYRSPNPRGADLQVDDLSPRNTYWLDRAAGVMVQDSDVDVTARRLWDNNDITRYDSHGQPRGMNWWQHCKPSVLASIRAPGSTILDFVAQTPTAASDGLFQMMYDTAVEEWTGALVNGQRIQAPRYLFDTDPNLAIEGGTMTAANLFMAKHLHATPHPSIFGTFAAFEQWVTVSYQKYNTGLRGYGAGVVSHSHESQPIPTAGMF